jgi:hypothetical protein
MSSPKAKSELLRISQQKDLDQAGKDLITSYLATRNQSIEPATPSSQKSNISRANQ